MQFGQIGFVTIQARQNKLEPKALTCVMIGYSADHSGNMYCMYNPETKKVLQSQDIKWADWHGISKLTDGMSGVFNSDGFGIEEIFVDNYELPNPNADTDNTILTAGRNKIQASPSKPVNIKSLEVSVLSPTWSSTNATLVEDEEEIPWMLLTAHLQMM